MRDPVNIISNKYVVEIASFALAFLGLGFVYRGTAREVQLVIDGEVEGIRTHSRTVQELFADVELEIDGADQINVAVADPLVDNMRIEIERAQPIELVLAGGSKVVRSALKTPANILADAGTRIFPGDRVWVDGYVLTQPGDPLDSVPASIRVELGIQIEILADGRLRQLRSSAPDVGHALLGAGLTINEADRVEPSLDTPLKQGMKIHVVRARPIDVQIGGQVLQVESAAHNVGAMLSATGLALAGMDYTLPDLGDPLPADGTVQVVRVAEDVLVELEPLPFETVYQPVDNLDLDSLQVQSTGTFGVQAERIRIRYEDGVEVNRTIEQAVTVVQPEPRVIGYGTKIVVRTLNTGSGTLEYWRAIPVYATSYSPCNLGVDRCGFTTASGTSVKRGTIGVIRSWFNQMRGWSVFVPGYGSGSIQDIGGGFPGRDWIDLGFTDENFEAWHDWTTLYFLTPVPPLDQIPWILP